jgi:hypothetical protein
MADRQPSAIPEARAVSRFLDLCAAAFAGVAADFFMREGYQQAITPAAVAIAVFLGGVFWPRIAQTFGPRVATTAADVATDFRWWLAVLGLLFVYLAAPPIVTAIKFRPDLSPAPGTPTVAIAEPPKAPMLALDDAKRWQLTKALHDASPASGSRVNCGASLHMAPNSQWPPLIWNDLQPILFYSGWSLQGASVTKNFFPPGITILSGKDQGNAFTCGFRLSEFLKIFKNIKTDFQVNQVTPDLIACKDECVEMIIGATPN